MRGPASKPPSFPLLVLGLSLLGGMTASRGRAQDACVPEPVEPGDLQLTPTSGSPESVTLDAPIIARFAAGTDVSFSDPATLLELRRVGLAGEETPVPGSYERFAAQPNVLVFRPDGGLDPDTAYVGDVVDPSGFEPRTLSFSTGQRADELAPRFASDAPRLSAREAASQCGEVRVDVVFLPADDVDGPRGSIEHLVYQTRGAGLDGPVLRQRVRAAMASELSASFLLSEQDASQPICVQVLAVDGTGRVGDPLGPTCFTPSTSANFVGLCALSPGSAPVSWAPWGALALLLALWVRRGWA